jgi:signal transduction histidine kinase
MDVKNGLPCTIVWNVAATQQQTFLYSECGLLTIDNGEMQRWWHDPDAQLRVSTLDALDGVQPSAGAWYPRSAVSSDGRVWFANTSVLQMFDPSVKRPPRPPLLIQIERILSDRTEYGLQSVMNLAPLIRDLQIDYTAPSFAAPERLRFRYKMSGIDDHWIEAGSRRQAFYHTLPPGNYNFQVSASEDGEVWSDHNPAVRFVVPPTFYQTWWFYTLCGLVLIALFAQIYRSRVNRLAAQVRSRLSARLEERERIARDLHDTLLQSTQGLILLFQGFAGRLSPADGMREEMEITLNMADRLLNEARASVGDLRSTGLSVDITDALGAAAQELRATNPIDFRVVIDGQPRPLMTLVADDVYRIGREALVNAFQHSKATCIELDFRFDDDALRMHVWDNGRGIEPELLREGFRADHFGLQGMRERAQRIGAKLVLRNRTPCGAEVQLIVPAAAAYQ